MSIISVENNTGYPLNDGVTFFTVGINEIEESAWEQFKTFDYIQSALETGQMKVLGTKEGVPESLRGLSLEQAKRAIEACQDNERLKHWYLDLEPDNYKPRLLIIERAMIKNLPLKFSEGELKTFHYMDRFKSLSDPDKKPIEPEKSPAQIQCERMTIKHKLWEEYQQKLQEIQ